MHSYKNLTRRNIRLLTVDGVIDIPPSGVVARLVTAPHRERIEILDDGVSLWAPPKIEGVTGLPDPVPDRILLVSSIVAAHCHGRDDVYYPGAGPRDKAEREPETGRVLFFRRLVGSARDLP